MSSKSRWGTTGTVRLEGWKAEVNNRGVENENGDGPGQAERGDQGGPTRKQVAQAQLSHRAKRGRRTRPRRRTPLLRSRGSAPASCFRRPASRLRPPSSCSAPPLLLAASRPRLWPGPCCLEPSPQGRPRPRPRAAGPTGDRVLTQTQTRSRLGPRLPECRQRRRARRPDVPARVCPPSACPCVGVAVKPPGAGDSVNVKFVVRTRAQSEATTICYLLGEDCVMDVHGEADNVAMEVEAEASPCRGHSSPVISGSPSQNSDRSMSSWRLGLKNSIQTNFGDDYVFQIASCQEISTLAVSLSTNALKFYSPETGQYLGECKGHEGTIHEISFSAPSSPQVICSCSSDGTVRAWDTRSFKQISLLRGGASQEMFTFSFGGSSGSLLAAGSNAQVLFWDWRSSKQIACLEESHMDDVTQVKFAPHQQSKLISAAVDGLICVFDTDGEIDEDNHLLSVMNAETSVAKVGFFGNTYQKLWCLTHIETLSVWDWIDGARELNMDDARSLATDRWNLDHVDYFVDCHYSMPDDRLWLIGGTAAGTLGYFPVRNDHAGAIGSAEAILEGGHTGVVRSVYPSAGIHESLGQNRGIFGWTGGEDGRLCCWRSDEIAEINKSWISSSLVCKQQKKTKNRHQPY